ncbi:unnamed protein product [Closterium sp. NIES-53]
MSTASTITSTWHPGTTCTTGIVARKCGSKGKGGRGGGGGSVSGGGGSGNGGGGSSGGGGGSGGSGGGGTGSGGTGARRTCGRLHTQHRCFSRLYHAWRAEFGDDVELPRWADLLKSRIDIFDLDCDAILSAMYALYISAEGDCYRCVPPDPGIAAAALGASESGTLPGTAPAEALHTFTLDSSASRCFFHDSTTLTPLPAHVPVRLADPSKEPVVARSSTILPCSAVPSNSLSGLHVPSFSTNFVSTAALQDAMVTTITPGVQRVSICTCARTGRHLATFTPRPGSSLLFCGTTAWVTPPCHVFVACTLAFLSLVFPGVCLPCRPRLPHLASLASRGGSALLLTPPRSPTTAPLQTLHMDVWGPARVSGQSRERYFLLVVDDYTRYTMVFPLRSKGQFVDVLISWMRTVRLQLRKRFGQDLPVLRLHSDRGGEFSSNLLREFFRGEGILQMFTLLDSPQQNGIAERRIGLVMEVARTSMIHATAPHFLWSFAVQYVAHQLNLWPHVSLPETSPTLRWMGKVGDASVFRVWGSRAFVRDMSADKLSPRAIPFVFLGFVLDAPGWHFYHPNSRRVFPSHDVTFDESVPFYRPPPVDPLPPLGPAPSGVSQVDPLPGPAPVQTGGAEPGGAATGGGEPRDVEPGGAESGGAEPQGAASSGGSAGASPSLSLQQLSDWFVRRTRLRSGASKAGGAGLAGAGGPGVAAGAGVTGGTATTSPGGARTRGTGAAGTSGVDGAGAGDLTESGSTGAGAAGVGGPGVGGAGARGAGAVDPGGAVRPQPYFVPLLQQVLGTPPFAVLTPPLLCPPPDLSLPPLQLASPLPASFPYTELSGGLTGRREPVSHLFSPVRTARRVPRSRPPPVPGTHAMTLRPSSVPIRVPLPPPAEVPDPESNHARAASPTVSCLLVTAVTEPSFESAAVSALVAELLDFAAACLSN